MFAFKELISWIVILILIVVNTVISSSTVNNLLFTLFYVLAYIFCTNRWLSLLGCIVLALVFDSINNISIGVSSTALIAISIIYLLENKISSSFAVKYILGLINLIILICYIKVIGIFISVPFINLITFYVVGVIAFTILLPIILIANRILANVK